jgi:hypothetical protein
MKKIVGIIAALALAGSVFARPDITPVITSFNGNAKLEWIADLDADTYGFANATWTEWKIQTKSGDWGGEANKSADGMWGELVLRTEGDFTKEPKAIDNIYDWNKGFDLKVSTAKVHFIDGDTYLNVDILKPDFGVGEIGYIRALKTNTNTNNWEDNKFPKVGGFDYHGFTVNFGIPIVDLTLAFGDDGAKSFKDGHYGFKFAATLKPIDGLSLYAGISKNTEENSDLALAFTAGYNYKIDDQFYLKPALQFDMKGKAMNIGAAVFFGWGAEGQNWNHDFLNFGKKDINVAENGTRAADGVSVLFIKGLKDAAGNDIKTSELDIEFYDSKLLSGLDIGTFTLGAAYRANGENLGKGALTFGAIYGNNFDIFYLTARLSFGMNLAVEGDNNGVAYGLKFGTKELIANTDLYIDYVGEISKYDLGGDGVKKGTVKLGCQINF